MNREKLISDGRSAVTVDDTDAEAYLFDAGGGVWRLVCFRHTTSDAEVDARGGYQEMAALQDSWTAGVADAIALVDIGGRLLTSGESLGLTQAQVFARGLGA